MKKILVLMIVAVMAILSSGCTSSNEPGTSVSGKITLSDEVAKKVTGNETLYIVARGSVPGMPLAVQTIKNPKFPLEYNITKEDAVDANTKFIGGITITVRLDRDGKIGDLEKGDFVGRAAKFPVIAGTKDVDVVIDTPAERVVETQ